MQRYNVVRGYAEIGGALYRKGSSFDAEPSSVKTELRKGIVVAADPESEPVREPAPIPEQKKRSRSEL